MMRKNFYFLGLLTFLGLGFTFYFLLSGEGRRYPAQSEHMSQQNYECELKAVLDNEENFLFENRVVTHESLESMDEYGFKGVYFDLFNVGGFSFYFEKKGFVLKTELEEQGTVEKKVFNSMPISQTLDLEVEFTKENQRLKAKSFKLSCKLLHHVHKK